MSFIERQLYSTNKVDSAQLKLIKDRAKLIERKAMMEEKVLRNMKDKTVEDEMAVNELYLDAITAKLKLLDRI